MRKFSIAIAAMIALAVSLVVVAQDDETFLLTVLHTNDTHGHHEGDGGDGGAAIQASVQAQVEAEVDNMLVLDAGDRFTGTLFHTLYVGQDQVDVMNALGYDAMVLGNHEFDNGDQALADFVAGLGFPVLSANVDFSESELLADAPIEAYTTIDVNGRMVGIIGVTAPDTPETSSPSPEIVFGDDLTTIVNEAAAQLTEDGVNIIILLSHSGILVELPLAETLENVDVVIGGHSHTLYSNAYSGAAGDYPVEFTSPLEEPVLYVQAGENNVFLGRLDLEFDANGVLTDWDGDTILLSRYITPDADVAAIVAELAVGVEALRGEPIGAEAAIDLDGNRTICRVEECHLGNLISDSMRLETGTDVAIMNAGGIRVDLEAGELTLGDILTLQPFSNLISTFDISGQGLYDAIENGVSRITLNEDGQISRDGASGRFPQVSGMRYSYDPTQEAGSRVVSIDILNAETGEFEPIDLEATYSVTTNNFVRSGGDGYEMFTSEEVSATAYDFGRIDYEVTADYMASISPIGDGDDGVLVDADAPRITAINAEVAPRN